MKGDGLDGFLAELDALSRIERSAFVAWFAGGRTDVTCYGSQRSVCFGKAECEWVDFNDFWLTKLPQLGWITVEEIERFTAIGMIGTPEAVRYYIRATPKGRAVCEAYWERVRKQLAEFEAEEVAEDEE